MLRLQNPRARRRFTMKLNHSLVQSLARRDRRRVKQATANNDDTTTPNNNETEVHSDNVLSSSRKTVLEKKNSLVNNVQQNTSHKIDNDSMRIVSPLTIGSHQNSKKLTLRLIPWDDSTHHCVSVTGRNPRVSLTVRGSKPLAAVIAHLERKWNNIPEKMSNKNTQHIPRLQLVCPHLGTFDSHCHNSDCLGKRDNNIVWTWSGDCSDKLTVYAIWCFVGEDTNGQFTLKYQWKVDNNIHVKGNKKLRRIRPTLIAPLPQPNKPSFAPVYCQAPSVFQRYYWSPYMNPEVFTNGLIVQPYTDDNTTCIEESRNWCPSMLVDHHKLSIEFLQKQQHLSKRSPPKRINTTSQKKKKRKTKKSPKEVVVAPEKHPSHTHINTPNTVANDFQLVLDDLGLTEPLPLLESNSMKTIQPEWNPWLAAPSTINPLEPNLDLYSNTTSKDMMDNNDLDSIITSHNIDTFLQHVRNPIDQIV